jgi:hypothetical protein
MGALPVLLMPPLIKNRGVCYEPARAAAERYTLPQEVEREVSAVIIE